MTLFTIVLLALGLSYVGIRSAFFAFRILAGFSWITVAVAWHYLAPIALGSEADTAIMLLMGLAALVFFFSAIGNEGTSQDKMGRIRSVFRVGSQDRTPVVVRRNWRQDAENYRIKTSSAVNGVRAVRRVR